jgi:uncharacterized protein involved in cysteine biosynthesis
MIEAPSLLFHLDALLPLTDFVSVGTNDLLQYMYAADRTNPLVSDRYDPLSPPALRALQKIQTRCAETGDGNLLALAVYLFAGPLAPVVFWVVNGYLLGREYFTMVAMRRVGRAGARALRRRHAGEIWLAGTLMAAPLSVPLVNLLIPVLGAATFTHLFHRLQARVPSPR